MKKRILCTAVCIAALTMAGGSSAIWTEAAEITDSKPEKTGLVKEDEHLRYYEDGQPVAKRWATVEGDTYYFDKEGNASILKCKIDGDYYVFDKEGRLLLPSSKKVLRVETQDGSLQTYYVDPKGKALSGWSADKKYYFDETGEMMMAIPTALIVMRKKKNFTAFMPAANGTRQRRRKYEKPPNMNIHFPT